MEICIEIRGPFSFLRNSLTNLNSSRHRPLRLALRPFYKQISNFQTSEVIAARLQGRSNNSRTNEGSLPKRARLGGIIISFQPNYSLRFSPLSHLHPPTRATLTVPFYHSRPQKLAALRNCCRAERWNDLLFHAAANVVPMSRSSGRECPPIGAPVDLWYLPFLSKITNLSLEYHQIITTFSSSSFCHIFIHVLSYYPHFVKALSYKIHKFVIIVEVTICGQGHDFQNLTLSTDYHHVGRKVNRSRLDTIFWYYFSSFPEEDVLCLSAEFVSRVWITQCKQAKTVQR